MLESPPFFGTAGFCFTCVRGARPWARATSRAGPALLSEGDYDFPDLVSFVQLVRFDDLRAAGLKVSGACKLEEVELGTDDICVYGFSGLPLDDMCAYVHMCS